MIPFVGASHPLPVDRVDLQRAVNLYPVSAEDAGEKAERHLAPAPGLTLWSSGSGEFAAYLSINNDSDEAVDGTTFSLTVTRTGATSGSSSVVWTATGDTFNGTEGFKRDDDAYTGTLNFGPGETAKVLAFTLEVVSETTFAALVTLSSPSEGTFIVDGAGTLDAVAPGDPQFASVILLSNFAGGAPDDVILTPAPDSTTGTPTLAAGSVTLADDETVAWEAAKLNLVDVGSYVLDVILAEVPTEVIDDGGVVFSCPLFKWTWDGTTAFVGIQTVPVAGVPHFEYVVFDGSTQVVGPTTPFSGEHFAFQITPDGTRIYHAGELVGGTSVLPSFTASGSGGKVTLFGPNSTFGDRVGPVSVASVRVTGAARYGGGDYTPPTPPLPTS